MIIWVGGSSGRRRVGIRSHGVLHYAPQEHQHHTMWMQEEISKLANASVLSLARLSLEVFAPVRIWMNAWD